MPAALLLWHGASLVGRKGASVASERALADVSAAAPGPIPVQDDAPPDAPRVLLERLPVTRAALDLPSTGPGAGDGRLYEEVASPDPAVAGPVRVEYTLDAELTSRVFRILKRGRVRLGHVILLDPASARVLAYASTDTEQFPPTRAYPAASLVKVITAAAALDRDPDVARLPCRYRGNPYRLTRSRLDPPRSGNEVSLRKALATSNNQCFAQLAVHAVGGDALVHAISRFGWLAEPGPAHDAGRVEPGEDRYDLGRLGCGLAGCRITPLHAAQLAGVLARGELVAPRWVDRVLDARGRELPLPASPTPRAVLTPELLGELRAMLVDTTERGTARRAFRKSNGRPLLGEVRVAGKTGSLSGKDPTGRYEWFVGVAPAENPRLAVAVLLVQGHLWWRNASQIAAQVLESAFCEDGSCSAARADRWIRSVPPPTLAPLAEHARSPGRSGPLQDGPG